MWSAHHEPLIEPSPPRPTTSSKSPSDCESHEEPRRSFSCCRSSSCHNRCDKSVSNVRFSTTDADFYKILQVWEQMHSSLNRFALTTEVFIVEAVGDRHQAGQRIQSDSPGLLWYRLFNTSEHCDDNMASRIAKMARGTVEVAKVQQFRLN